MVISKGHNLREAELTFPDKLFLQPLLFTSKDVITKQEQQNRIFPK
jgi:hypothetical protein